MHGTSHSDIPDMIHLGDLTEGAICRNILLRYKKDKIYVSFFEKYFSNTINEITSRHILVQF
jgi:hypothetical protein